MLCHRCLEGKFTKLHFNNDVSTSICPFEVVHTDMWARAPYVSTEWFKYDVIFIDECTRYYWIFPLCNEGEVCSTFVPFYIFILNQFNVSIKILQSDGGWIYRKIFQIIYVGLGNYPSYVMSLYTITKWAKESTYTSLKSLLHFYKQHHCLLLLVFCLPSICLSYQQNVYFYIGS